MSAAAPIDVRYAGTVLAVIVPPLAVYLSSGELKSTIINVVLCFALYLPGIIHAVYTLDKADPLNGKKKPAAETTP